MAGAMDSIRYGLKVQLPRLSQQDLMYMAPFILFVTFILFAIFAGGKGSKDSTKARVNHKIDLNKDKVATAAELVEIEDLCNKSKSGNCAYCRCWKSKKFPYCDGSHVKHNKETGDNVGPLVIKGKGKKDQ